MKKILFIIILTASTLGIKAQENIEVNADRAETLFTFLLQNNADSLYANISDTMKPRVKKQHLENIMKMTESLMGPYISHSAWEEQLLKGERCYTSRVTFEKGEIKARITFDDKGKMLAIHVTPEASLLR